jgi:2-dehydropantoate 2-reductase
VKVVVVGAGAIGGYVGAKLALAGHAVTLVGRQPLADAVSARGLHLIEPDGERVIRDCRVVTSLPAAFAPDRCFDLGLFTVKSYDTQPAIDDLRPHAQRVDRFLSLQNGIGGEEALSEAFGAEKVIAGTILNPVTAREPGVIVLEKRRGGIGLSAWVSTDGTTNQRMGGFTHPITSQASDHAPDRSAPLESLTVHMRQAGLVIRQYADARALKWSKLLLNLIGNASSAILDLNTLQVFADKRLFTIEIAMLRETLRVARAEGIRLVGLPGYPVPLLAAGVRYLPLPLLQPVLIPLVARGRGAKLPSLHIDLTNGRRRSEIDALNGAVVRAGARRNMPTPANALLVETFKALQAGQGERRAWRRRADRLWAAYSSSVNVEE